MKLCWDTLKDIYLTKNGNLRHRSRGIVVIKEECEICGEMYIGKEKNKYCSKECSIKGVAKSNTGQKRSKETKKKLSESAKKRTPTTKHSLESVTKHFYKYGYIVLSEKYVNNKSKLKIKCPKGHIWNTSYFNFQQGNRCWECSGKKKHTYEYIKDQIESVEEGYKLLSKEYIGAHKKLRVCCDKGHEYEVTYGNFKHCNNRCPVCALAYVTSKGEKEVYQMVKELTDELVIENDRTQIVNSLTGRNLELDIYIPSLKKAIEYNGEYWHSNDLVMQRDKEKIKQCKEKGIDLLIIKEKEWLNHKEVCFGRIKELLLNENN